MSTVECLPVVHGGMDKNSSKVRTRGLQQFQPEPVDLVYTDYIEIFKKGRADTFLPFMKDWRARMIKTWLFRVGKLLATPFVDTLLRHFRWRSCESRSMGGKLWPHSASISLFRMTEGGYRF